MSRAAVRLDARGRRVRENVTMLGSRRCIVGKLRQLCSVDACGTLGHTPHAAWVELPVI
jgi:hypothetical protein